MIEDDKVQRIICGPYQYFVFFDFSVSPVNTTQGLFRNDASCGIPVMKNDSSCFWGLGELNSWRHHLSPIRSQATDAQMVFYLDGTLYDSPASSGTLVFPQLLSLRSSDLFRSIPFADDTYAVTNTLLCMGTNSGIKTFGIWDAFVHGQAQLTKVTSFADLHPWEAFTIQPFDSGVEVGCLWLANGSQSSLRVGAYSH
jgi:hypothetical protein